MLKHGFLLLLVGVIILTLAACSGSVSNQKPDTAAPMKMDNSLSQIFDWELLPPAMPYQIGQENTITFLIKEKDSMLPVRNFETVHEKRSHLILVSKDLSVFEHLHPAIVGPGKMQTQAFLPKPGSYVLFLQFSTPDQGEQTLRNTLTVEQSEGMSTKLIPDADQTKELNGYIFKLSDYPKRANEMSMPTFSIEKEGKPVGNIQPYLGAGGHGVIISQDTKSFLHVHPMAKAKNGVYQSPLMFHANVEKPGLYKIWGQFQIDGKLETVDFTFTVN